MFYEENPITLYVVFFEKYLLETDQEHFMFF